MYFANTIIVLAGLSSITGAATTYDDGMYHPVTPTVAVTISQATSTTASAVSQVTTSTASAVSQATTYVSSAYGSTETWYPTLSKSTYVGYWTRNATTTTSSGSSKSSTVSATYTGTTKMGSNNMTMTMKPGNVSMTMTVSDRVYTTTVCDFESSCYTTLATATGGFGQFRTTSSIEPTMTPFSSSDRLIASGWGALVLCGIAMLL